MTYKLKLKIVKLLKYFSENSISSADIIKVMCTDQILLPVCQREKDGSDLAVLLEGYLSVGRVGSDVWKVSLTS